MEQVVTVLAHADRTADVWCCTAAPVDPWTGLFAYGPTFAEARQGLARTVWAQLSATQPAPTVDAVRVLCITRKTFGAVTLTLER